MGDINITTTATYSLISPTRNSNIPLPSPHLNTPLGHQDRFPKIQLCLEFRKKEVQSRRSNTLREQKLLEVTVMWVKFLPRMKDKVPNPFVKLTLHPCNIIFTTELKPDRTDAQYIEVFEFLVDEEVSGNRNLTSLKGATLEVQVCDRKATRNAKSFGNVVISLDTLELGKPLCEWYKLASEPLQKT